MSKDKIQLLSPLFLKYQSDFEKNPRSRVFAPLAETYRKLGMTDKAMEILSQGIRYNPSYIMGYLGLAFCYFDLKQFHLTYTTLRPLVEENRDNLRLQKLFADCCIELEKKDEALETLKYLLFINPKDKIVADLVVSLEKEIEERYRPHHKPIYIPENDLSAEKNQYNKDEVFDVDKLEDIQPKADFDDWMTVNLNNKKDSISSGAIEKSEELQDKKQNYDHWNVKKIEETLETIERIKDSEDKRTFKVELLYEESEVKTEADLLEEEEIQDKVEKEAVELPLVTHTLVDLYCGQGHIEKALEVLEKILLLNPTDQKTIQKISEIKALVQPVEEIQKIKPLPSTQSVFDIRKMVAAEEVENVSEEEGRRQLMNLIDQNIAKIVIENEVENKFGNTKQKTDKLTNFLKKIQKRALEYQGRV